VATSKFLLSITDTSAAWIYLNRGCVIPLIAVPSIVGLMPGSILGLRILPPHGDMQLITASWGRGAFMNI
jgi:uncharacterized membrane protein YfcA